MNTAATTGSLYFQRERNADFFLIITQRGTPAYAAIVYTRKQPYDGGVFCADILRAGERIAILEAPTLRQVVKAATSELRAWQAHALDVAALNQLSDTLWATRQATAERETYALANP